VSHGHGARATPASESRTWRERESHVPSSADCALSLTLSAIWTPATISRWGSAVSALLCPVYVRSVSPVSGLTGHSPQAQLRHRNAHGDAAHARAASGLRTPDRPVSVRPQASPRHLTARYLVHSLSLRHGRPLWCVCESDVYRLIAYVSHRSVSSLNCQSRTHSDSVPYIRSQTAVSRSEPLGSVTVSPPLRDSALRTAGSGGLSGLRAGRAVLRHLRSRSLAASRSASGRRARCTMVMDGYATVIGIAYRG
jgi:hypothetical protein